MGYESIAHEAEGWLDFTNEEDTTYVCNLELLRGLS